MSLVNINRSTNNPIGRRRNFALLFLLGAAVLGGMWKRHLRSLDGAGKRRGEVQGKASARYPGDFASPDGDGKT